MPSGSMWTTMKGWPMFMRSMVLMLACLSLGGCEQVFGKWYQGRWVVDGEKTSQYNKESEKGVADLVGFFQSLEYRVDEDEVLEITDTSWIITEGEDDVEIDGYALISDTGSEAKLKVGGSVRHLVKDGKWIYLQLSGNTRIYFKKAGG